MYDEMKNDQEELNESEVYLEKYGFEHDCRCAEDWAEGNWAVVSVCYVNMCGEALDRLEVLHQELRQVKAELAEAKMGLTDG
jgi:hypothetical protein